MISGGMIAGGQTVPAPAAVAPAAAAPEPLPGVATGQYNIAGTEVPREVFEKFNLHSELRADRKLTRDMKNMDFMSQFWSGLFNFGGQIGKDIIQGIVANSYFNSQITISTRQAEAAENIAGKQLEWQNRAADSADYQANLLYGPNGYARDRDQIRAQAAVDITREREKGRTERAALRGVDEAFGFDSRDSYGYGNPFAAA